MENTQLPPNVPQNNPSGEPNLPPGTFEYIDNKKDWKKFFEICGLVLIIAVPVVLSFYHVDYSLARVYQVVSNPTEVGIFPGAYQTWGGVIKATKQLIQPAATPTQIPPTATPIPSNYPTTQSTQPANQSSEVQNQEIISPTEFPIQPEEIEEIVAPTLTPTFTPAPTMTPTPADEEYVSPAIVACYDKGKNEKCFYESEYGDIVDGRCRTYGGSSLICVPY